MKLRPRVRRITGVKWGEAGAKRLTPQTRVNVAAPPCVEHAAIVRFVEVAIGRGLACAHDDELAAGHDEQLAVLRAQRRRSCRRARPVMNCPARRGELGPTLTVSLAPLSHQRCP